MIKIFSPTDKIFSSNGDVVIMEQRNPIHSVWNNADGDTPWLVNYGGVSKTDVDKLAKTATTNKTYRGMITIKRR